MENKLRLENHHHHPITIKDQNYNAIAIIEKKKKENFVRWYNRKHMFCSGGRF